MKDITEIYKTIGNLINEAIPDKWTKVHINVQSDGDSIDYVSKYYAKNIKAKFFKGFKNIVRKEKEGHSSQFEITSEIDGEFFDLYETMAQSEKTKWTECDFILHSNGELTVDFKNEPIPPRYRDRE